MLLKQLLSWRSPAGSQARLSILVLHRVLPAPDPLLPDCPDAVAFERLCRWIRSHFNVLPLTDAVRRLTNGMLSERALCITFDDGYADNHDVALPILQCHGLSAAIFVTTGVLGDGCMWSDVLAYAVRSTKRAALPLHDLELPGVGLEQVGTPAQRLVLTRQHHLRCRHAWRGTQQRLGIEAPQRITNEHPAQRQHRLPVLGPQGAIRGDVYSYCVTSEVTYCTGRRAGTIPSQRAGSC